MSAPKALIIDDEPDICDLISLSLSKMNVESVTAQSMTQAKDLLNSHSFHFCLTDMRLPDGDGLDLLSYIQQHHPHLPVAVITAHGTMDSAISALKSGAFDFVPKPIDLHILRDLALTALKLQDSCLLEENDILGESQAILELKQMLHKVSRSQAPIYISGPSGAGKELVAKVIHKLSPRKENPFVAINCGAIPKELMESEFFGHLKGSFTGAHQNKQGLFQAANKGTLLLDEVADLPLEMQVKLLRAIQERAIKPVGANQETIVDVRILCATHQDLHALVREGKFREDLFYRLNVIELKVPSLSQRLDDIELLCNHILSQFAKDQGLDKPTLSEEALDELRHYSFPGNVRELENILARAFALCEQGTIQSHDLQLPKYRKAVGEDSEPLADYLDSVEKDKITLALEKTGGNKTQAAKLLGISFRQLRYRLKKLNLDS